MRGLANKRFERAGQLLGFKLNVREAATAQVVKRDEFVEVIVKGMNQNTLASVVEPVGFVIDVKKIRINHLLATQMAHHVVGPVAIHLNKVVGKHWAVVLVTVHQAQKRVNTCLNKCSFYIAIQHTVGIVEQAVKHITGRVLASASKLVARRQSLRQVVKIHPTHLAFVAPVRRVRLVCVGVLGVFEFFLVLGNLLGGLVGGCGAVGAQRFEQFNNREVVVGLSDEQLPYPLRCFGTGGKGNLIFANGANRPKAVAPNPPNRKTLAINKQQLNLMLQCGGNGLISEFCSWMQANTFDIGRSHKVFLVGGAHPKPPVLNGKAGAFFVENKLHSIKSSNVAATFHQKSVV